MLPISEIFWLAKNFMVITFGSAAIDLLFLVFMTPMIGA
jgi:hypothetical protein